MATRFWKSSRYVPPWRRCLLPILALALMGASPAMAVNGVPLAAGAPEKQELQGAEAYFHFAMAKLAQQQQRYDAAVAFLREAAAADPESAGIQAELAATYMIIRDYPAAEESARLALAMEPDNSAAHTVLAHLYYSRARRGIDSQANRRRAMDEMEASLRGQNEDAPDVLLTLGRFYFEQGKFRRAADFLLRFLETQPAPAPNPLFLLARAHIQLEDYDGAERALEQILDTVPDSLQALETLVNIERLRGDFAGSLPLLEKILAIRGGDGSLYKKMGEAYFHLHQYPDAIEMFNLALNEEPGSPYSLYYLALSQERSGQMPRALETLEQMHVRDPENTEVVFRMAQLQERLGNPRAALELYSELLDLLLKVEDPDDPRRTDISTFCARVALIRMELEEYAAAARGLDACRNDLDLPAPGLGLLRARALIFARRDEKALSEVRKGREQFPQDPRFQILEAEILLQTGDEEQAGHILDARLAAAAAGDGDGAGTRALVADAWFNAGAQAERRQEIERAERYLLRAIGIDPEHAAALNYLGYTWADGDRNLDEALDLLQRAVAQDPENGSYQDSLGWVYYRLGRLQEAREHLLNAVNYEADDPTIRDHLGDLEQEAGHLDLALSYWRESLKLGADDPAAVSRKVRDAERSTARP